MLSVVFLLAMLSHMGHVQEIIWQAALVVNLTPDSDGQIPIAIRI